MERKVVLAIVLCLAAALTIGAAPALAASGCTCHTAVPPTGGAPAAHAPLVVGVDCTTCHVDWVVPHPDLGMQWLWPSFSSRAVTGGRELSGWLGTRVPRSIWNWVTVGHPDVVVYLQQRLWGATEFTDLTQVTTDALGNFGFTVNSPPHFAAYRAIARGRVGPGGGLYEPTSMALPPTPELTLKLHAPFVYGILEHPAYLTLGDSVRVNGTVRPGDLGGRVIIRVQRRGDHGHHTWFTRIRVTRAISATGTYSWKFTPGTRGRYRVGASIPATAVHARVGTGFIPQNPFGGGFQVN